MMDEAKTFVPQPVYRHEIAALEALAVATAAGLRHLLMLIADPHVDRKELARVGEKISAALATFHRK